MRDRFDRFERSSYLFNLFWAKIPTFFVRMVLQITTRKHKGKVVLSKCVCAAFSCHAAYSDWAAICWRWLGRQVWPQGIFLTTAFLIETCGPLFRYHTRHKNIQSTGKRTGNGLATDREKRIAFTVRRILHILILPVWISVNELVFSAESPPVESHSSVGFLVPELVIPGRITFYPI
jgi:hypothetical protein